MEKRALIVVFNGDEPSMEAIRKSIEALATRTRIQDGTIEPILLSEKEIAQALIVKASQTLSEGPTVVIDREKPENAAARYMGIEFARAIISGPIDFAAVLAARYISAIHNYDDDTLKTNVRILATGQYENIDLEVRAKYNFDEHYFNIVRDIYQQCVGRIG